MNIYVHMNNTKKGARAAVIAVDLIIPFVTGQGFFMHVLIPYEARIA